MQPASQYARHPSESPEAENIALPPRPNFILLPSPPKKMPAAPPHALSREEQKIGDMATD